MTGCYDSVIGMNTLKSIKRFVKKLPERFEVAEGEGTLCGVLLDLNEHTGLCRAITRIRTTETMSQAEAKIVRLAN